MAGSGGVNIEVLRPGVFTPMAGAPITFSEDDLKALAAAYDDKNAPAPAVVGHPKLDAPACAWATAFAYDGDKQRLTASLGEIEPAFAEAVAQGRYKKISLSLFTPDAPNNPKPGAWYPKHIGFLGAAAPAVSGLKPVSFAQDEGVVTLEFSGAGFVFPATPKEPVMTKPDPAPDVAVAQELDERARKLDARERALLHADNVAFAETLIADGKLAPALQAKVVGLLDTLSPVAGAQLDVRFADDGDAKTTPALQLIKEVLGAQPRIVAFGSADLGRAPQDGVADFALPDGARVDPASAEIHARALAHQAAHPGVDYMAAVAAAAMGRI